MTDKWITDKENILDAVSLNWAVFSEDRAYRFFLRRKCANAAIPYLGGVAMFIGANPSKGGEVENDLTITKETHWAGSWGYEWMWNLKAAVGTDPKSITGMADPIGPYNDLWIVTCAEQADIVVCAYGDLGKDRASTVEWKLRQAGLADKLYCFGLTKSGYPKHPSRIGYKTSLMPYEALH